MGMLILMVVGSIFGWLAAIVTQAKMRDTVALNVAVGGGVALLAGTMTYDGPILSGISATGLIVAIIGSIVALTVLGFTQRRTIF